MGNEAFQNASFGNASFPNEAFGYSCLWAMLKLVLQLPKTILGRLLFFTVNDHFQEGETLGKRHVKPNQFLLNWLYTPGNFLKEF